MINRLNLSIPLIALLLVSCAGGISSQSSFESSSSNTFTVSFDSRGGSIVPNQIVEPNSFISPPNVSKEGHNLEGWYTSLNGGVTLENKWNFFIDRVNFNFTLIALWTVNQYTLTFESNGGSVIPSFTINYGDNLNILTTTKVGHSFVGWYTDVGLTQSFTLTTMPATNLTLYAKWTINQYTITFETNGGSSIASITGDYGDAVSVPSDPTREGYTFNGWYADVNLTEATTVPNTIPSENQSFYSKWQAKTLSLSMGGFHSSLLTISSRVFMWGLNNSGQLGDGTTTNKSNPTEITSNFPLLIGEKFTELSMGRNHSSVLTSNGRVFTWGSNDLGQLGDGTRISRSNPTEITSNFSIGNNENIVNLIMGSYTSSALSSTGRVFVWGNNQNGQLGDGTTIRRTIPTEITSNFPLLIGEKITQLSMGGDHSSVLTSNGRVFTWGLNDSGQLGDGTTVSTSSPIEITSNFPIDNSEKISFLSLGVSHSSAFSSNGRIFVWGRNGSGQLGDGTSVSKSIPIDIRANFPLSIDEKIVSLSSGSDHSTALFESGRIFVWGMYITGVNVSNHNGNISTSFGHNWEPVESTSNFFLNGDEIILYSSIGDSHLSFLSSLGYVYIFGNNSYGQIGNFTNGNYSNTPFRLIV